MDEQNSRENTKKEKVNEEIEAVSEDAVTIADDTGNPETGEEEKKDSLFNDFLEILESVVISVFTVLLIFTFIARPVTVDGLSMFPTLNNEDKLIMRTIFYTPKVGDIVIIEHDESYIYEKGTNKLIEVNGLEKRLIKRVIAVGGQTIDIDSATGTVTVDGEVRNEPFINNQTVSGSEFDYPLTVPEGYIFVMGDNRNNSTDSRSGSVGFVKNEDVIGEAVLRFWPVGDFGLLD